MVLAIAVVVAMEWGRTTLHPWVLRNGVDDYGMSDSRVLGGTAVALLLALALSSAQRQLPLARALGVGIAALAFAFLQPYVRPVAFAWNDVAAAVLGFAFAFVAGSLVWRRLRDNPAEVS